MSIEIDWLSLTPSIAEKLTDRLNGLLKNSNRPEFIGPITIQSISFGDIPPEVEIIDIRDVSRGFRIASDSTNPQLESSSSSPPSSSPSPECGTTSTPIDQKKLEYQSGHSKPSLQIHIRLSYNGNLRIRFSTSLVLNYPSLDFMSLPFRATVVGIGFDAEIILAIEGDRSKLHLSLLEPPQPSDLSLHEDHHHYNHPDNNLFRRNTAIGTRILPHLVVESEVGNSDRHVLRNVGKVERFLTETVRNLICEELLYPTFQTFEWD